MNLERNSPEIESLSSAGGPSYESIIAATSKDPDPQHPTEKDNKPVKFYDKCAKFFYNKENNTYCGRTCLTWARIILHSLVFLVFLITYTIALLFGSLAVIKKTVDYSQVKLDLQVFSRNGIGLTATPVSALGNNPLIWYKNGDAKEYKIYVDAIDKLLIKNKFERGGVSRSDLGPCANPPYGYGDKPCVIIRINKMVNWSAKPLDSESANARNAPLEVKNWIKSKKNMLWLYCSGYHSYDKEHIKNINYYPDPPGFDPDVFPLDMKSEPPLVAVQISDFTIGLSLAIECTLWYENGTSTVEFMLYVKNSIGYNRTDL